MEPPLVGVAIHPSRHTHDMIKYSEEFALNIPTRELLHHVQYLGSTSGRELDKFELTRLPTFSARRIDAPLLEGCAGWIECGVHDAITTGDHTLFIGKVVAVQVEQEAFGDVWSLDDPELQPLHYLGVNFYGLLRERLEARIPAASDIKRDVDAGQATVGDAQETSERREQRDQAAEESQRGEW
jgi:flavin reductase (DIM6/NTAB) family NADH-FMN oxidoreductase RutF